MDKLRALSHFVACAEEGSFSGAARRLGLSVPSVHKLVTALEQSLGIRLFQRSSRGLTLTASGETYLEACRPLLAELVAVDETLRRSAQRPTGTLVIAAHSQLALHVLLPALPRFHSLYPDIRIDIRVIHRLTDADAQIADVFVLHGWPEANDLVHRQLGHTRALIVGAPEYWASRGIRRHPHELDQHTCVLIRNPAGILIDLWEFERGTEKMSVKVNGWLCSSGREVVLDGVLVRGEPSAAQSLDDDAASTGRRGRLRTGAVADWEVRAAHPSTCSSARVNAAHREFGCSSTSSRLCCARSRPKANATLRGRFGIAPGTAEHPSFLQCDRELNEGMRHP